MTSTGIFTTSLTTLRNGSLSTLDGTTEVLNSFSPAVTTAFGSVKLLVNSRYILHNTVLISQSMLLISGL